MSAAAASTSHRTIAVLARQVLPGDPCVQHMQDPVEGQAIVDRLAAWIG